jgi:hypothetical protein
MMKMDLKKRYKKRSQLNVLKDNQALRKSLLRRNQLKKLVQEVEIQRL